MFIVWILEGTSIVFGSWFLRSYLEIITFKHFKILYIYLIILFIKITSYFSKNHHIKNLYKKRHIIYNLSTYRFDFHLCSLLRWFPFKPSCTFTSSTYIRIFIQQRSNMFNSKSDWNMDSLIHFWSMYDPPLQVREEAAATYKTQHKKSTRDTQRPCQK